MKYEEISPMVNAQCDMQFEHRLHMEYVSFRLELLDNNISIILSTLSGHGLSSPMMVIVNHDMTIVVQDGASIHDSRCKNT